VRVAVGAERGHERVEIVELELGVRGHLEEEARRLSAERRQRTHHTLDQGHRAARGVAIEHR
jgi:hypothetical protein